MKFLQNFNKITWLKSYKSFRSEETGRLGDGRSMSFEMELRGYGNLSSKMVRGEAERRLMEPPLSRIICRARESPMPLPLFFVVKKGVKMCLATSSGIGSPSLPMSITTASLESEYALNQMFLVPGAWIAFFKMLATTWPIKSSSA